MNTIVFNLSTLGVTEYTAALTGISGDYETTSAGLHRVSESVDPVAATVSFGAKLGAGGRLVRSKYLYLFGAGLDGFSALVADTKGNSYEYPLQMRHSDAARFVLGAGIRDNYLSVTLRRESAEPLRLDRLEFETLVASTRRL